MDLLQFGRPFIGHEFELIITLIILMVVNTIAGVVHSNEIHKFETHKLISQIINKILTLAIIIPVYYLNKQKTIIEVNSLVICLMLLKELMSSALHIFKFNFKTYNSFFEAFKSKDFSNEVEE